MEIEVDARPIRRWPLGPLFLAAVHEGGRQVSPNGVTAADFAETAFEPFAESQPGWQNHALPVGKRGERRSVSHPVQHHIHDLSLQ